MATSESVDWDVCERCSEDGGIGICLPSGGKCWTHATESDLEPALKQLRESGRLDARGVPITQELLERLLASAPRNDNGHPILTDARFDEAAFHPSAIFSWVIFQGETIFSGATFEAVARFNGATFCGDVGFRATFRGEAIFSGVTFQAVASMHEATFQGFARFDDATFQGFAGFERAAFLGDAMFRRASFQDVAWFTGATFHSTAWFETAVFQGDAHFRRTSFEGFAYFERTTFQRDAGFGGATFQASALLNQVAFQHARQLGSMLVHKSLVLDQAVFHERVQIEASAWAVCCRRARFLAGVQLRARWAQVVLDDADLAAPSLLIGVPVGFGPDEERFARAWWRLLPPRVRDGRPRLLSLRRADVAGLTVSNVDLRACRFLGAHNLDKLRSEGNARFGFTRSALATSRQTIAEEHHWRISRDATSSWRVLRRGWYPAHYQPPDWLEVEAASPAQVAGLYRALRKGREDNKDEPGAADFYYGEMEMRRHARHQQARQDWQEGNQRTWAAAQTEHAILWLYWLVSGYGLRAWRALATFGVLLVVSAALFTYAGGFEHSSPPTAAVSTPVTSPSGGTVVVVVPQDATAARVSFWDALSFSARTAVGLPRDPQPRLTPIGDLVQILLRILAPVLLGLAVLSVRGRVKR